MTAVCLKNYFFVKISERLGVIFSDLIFKYGFVHADPHPGNVLINPTKDASKKAASKKKDESDFQIVLIDHGLYQVNLQLTKNNF